METNTDPQNWLGSPGSGSAWKSMRIHNTGWDLLAPDLNPEVQITDGLSSDLSRIRNIAMNLKQFNLLTFE